MEHQRGRFSSGNRESFGGGDFFGNLARYIETTKGHPGLIHNPTRRVQKVIQDIERTEGKYAVKNVRVLEWVNTLVFEILLNKNKPHARHRIYQTNINDDILNHLDAYGAQKQPSGEILYYGIDFTFDRHMVNRKAELLGSHASDIRVARGYVIPVPTLVVHTKKGVILKIAERIDALLEKCGGFNGEVTSEDLLTIVNEVITLYIADNPVKILIPRRYTRQTIMKNLGMLLPTVDTWRPTTHPSPRSRASYLG